MHTTVHKHRDVHTQPDGAVSSLWERMHLHCPFAVSFLGGRRELMLKCLMSYLSSRHLSHLLSLCIYKWPSILLSCFLLASDLLLSPVSLHSPLPISPYNAICLTVAQHSMSWLCLNIDRKVNDNTTVLQHKLTKQHTNIRTQRSYNLTPERSLLCSLKTMLCYGWCQKTIHAHTWANTHRCT